MMTQKETELREALKPFAELLHRRWGGSSSHKQDLIVFASQGGMVRELQPVELKDVLRAHELVKGGE